MTIKVKGILRPGGRTIELDFPKIIERTITAEEISNVWYEDYLQALLGFEVIKPGDLVKTVWEENNSLDQGMSLDDVLAYSSAATIQEALDNHESSGGVIGNVSPDGTYRYGITHGTTSYGTVLKTNAKFGLVFTGDAAPTTGEVTIKIEMVSK